MRQIAIAQTTQAASRPDRRAGWVSAMIAAAAAGLAAVGA